MSLRRPLLLAIMLCSSPVLALDSATPGAGGDSDAPDWGLSYTREFGQFHTQFSLEVVEVLDAAPYYDGASQVNVITLHNRSGIARAIMIGIGSASEEADRRGREASASGGYYHRESPGLPSAVPGGNTRLSFYWGDNGTWHHRSLSYTDSSEPRQISDLPLAWSTEVRVRLGSLRYKDWTSFGEPFSNTYLSLLQVGPVVYFAPRVPLRPLFSLGARIDPVFKPLMGLAVEETPMLDAMAYLRAEAWLLPFLNLGAEVSAARGFLSIGQSRHLSASVSLGLFI